jgi:ssDNA thymidine ADP-ribosyltransferase, DarT
MRKSEVPGQHADLLNPEKALIFRITHRDNVPWILENGLHAKNGALSDPNFRPIGNRDLIQKRTDHPVPTGPCGTLSDYIPFYFTPFSIMLFNIKTGYNGVPKVPNEEIVILVSSLRRVSELRIPFVFTDLHAYLRLTEHFTNLGELSRIDWGLLQSRDFKRDNNDLGKTDRYQAEALIWRHLPVSAILGIVCNTEAVRDSLKERAVQFGLELDVVKTPSWYF